MNNVEVIFGPPGCGKTTRLLSILDELLSNDVSPKDIAFVSFTNKGVDAGVERAREKFGISKSGSGKEDTTPFWRTLHSIGNRVCFQKSKRTLMLGRKVWAKFGSVVNMRLTGYVDVDSDVQNPDDTYLHVVNLEKNNPERAEKAIQDYLHGPYPFDLQKLSHLRIHLEEYKHAFSLYDFTDMIKEYVDNADFGALPVRYALVDEAQDLTPLQWDMVEKAFANCDKVFLAGDDDQAIYDWSGGSVSRFLSYRNGSNTEILSQSYRLNSEILALSQSIVHEIAECNRQKKDVFPIKISQDRHVFVHDKLEDVQFFNSEERSCLCLSRNRKYLPRFVGNFLSHYSLPFRLHQAKEPTRYPRKVTPKTINKIGYKEKAYNKRMQELGYSRAKETPKDGVGITISTIHKVKGEEADDVVLLLDMAGATYENAKRNAEEEIRCLYVGITRTKGDLHVVKKLDSTGYGMQRFYTEEEL